MKTLYIDCSSGVSGDMLLGAFIDSGVDLNLLKKKIDAGLPHIGDLGKKFRWEIKCDKVLRNNLPGVEVKVLTDRSVESIKNVIKRSKFSEFVKSKSLEAFHLLEKSEAKVHKTSKQAPSINVESWHSDEHSILKSFDTLIDIVGNFLMIELLKIDKIHSSPLNIGSPAPATLEIIKQKKIPVYSSTNKYELTTPTGAALISTLSDSFIRVGTINVESFGFGAGSFDFPEFPNLLKIIIYEEKNYRSEVVVLLETNIDDMDPRLYPVLMENLFSLGALDVWFCSVYMKKGRPGMVLSVLVRFEDEPKVLELLFNKTTTLGIRRLEVPRVVLPRKCDGIYKIKILPSGKKVRYIEFEKMQ